MYDAFAAPSVTWLKTASIVRIPVLHLPRVLRTLDSLEDLTRKDNAYGRIPGPNIAKPHNSPW